MRSIGTPAEEGGGGKIELLEQRWIRRATRCRDGRTRPGRRGRAQPYRRVARHIQYKGKSAHAAAYPERGVNAADAFTIAQVAIGLLRQQLPSSRAGTRHDDPRRRGAQRHPGAHRRSLVCASRDTGRTGPGRGQGHGAASRPARWHRLRARGHPREQTVCGVPRRRSRSRVVRATATRLGRRFAMGTGSTDDRASTDMGNVSQTLPAIHPYIGIDSLPAAEPSARIRRATFGPQPEQRSHTAARPCRDRRHAASRTRIRHRLLGE